MQTVIKCIVNSKAMYFCILDTKMFHQLKRTFSFSIYVFIFSENDNYFGFLVFILWKNLHHKTPPKDPFEYTRVTNILLGVSRHLQHLKDIKVIGKCFMCSDIIHL